MTQSAKHTLSGLVVNQAMRRQVVRVLDEAPASTGINLLIKYKLNALLVIDRDGRSTGVLSKTDIMSAWYAGLPLDIPVDHIMSSPPIFCTQGDSLEHALSVMKNRHVYRLYVISKEDESVAGVLAYPDIVGLLYRYCHNCEFSHRRIRQTRQPDTRTRIRVREVMTGTIRHVQSDSSLTEVMEILSEYRFGSLLVKDSWGLPCGVISKTDLVLAYRHSLEPSISADRVMSSPVETCRSDDFLEEAIKTMIHTDVHRLFVREKDPLDLCGVISLTDAARIRSGSCHACMSSRIKLDGTR